MKKYELSIGLKDKDTKTQIIDTETAKQIIIDFASAFDGFTLIQTVGGYKHDDGTKVIENGFILVFFGFSKEDEENIIAIKDNIKKALNQENVYVNAYDFVSLAD